MPVGDLYLWLLPGVEKAFTKQYLFSERILSILTDLSFTERWD
jgi:hypothetical protein